MAGFTIRNARPEDAGAIAGLIAVSVRGLAKGIYDDRQIELSVRSVFGVDHQLIADGTYFAAKISDRIVGCGGWSMRKTLYGASGYALSREPEKLDAATDAAKIRAFFVHPDAARQGIGRAILERCEAAARTAGFRWTEMMATLPGVPLYLANGYVRRETVAVPVGEGVHINCIRMGKEL